jgi:NAD(P)-dependent dehydrogenase (short-subunit alcohol dehydrogenase family)
LRSPSIRVYAEIISRDVVLVFLSRPTMAEIPCEPPSRGLKGKVAIVTGAGCAGDGIGNGRAISIMLADEGCNVLCLDLNLEWAQKTAEIASSKSGRGKTVAIKADVTKALDCEAAVKSALEEFGKLDILVNNVGIGGAPGTAVEVDMEAWAKGLEINVSSMVQMAKYAIPAMQKNEGAVVNMTRAMSAHHAADGIRVNCVCPGVRTNTFFLGTALLILSQMLYTPMMYAGGMSEETREARRKRSLLGTEGTAWDAACAVTFLASDHARWVTGAILPIDAGVTAAVGVGMPKSASVNG